MFCDAPRNFVDEEGPVHVAPWSTAELRGEVAQATLWVRWSVIELSDADGIVLSARRAFAPDFPHTPQGPSCVPKDNDRVQTGKHTDKWQKNADRSLHRHHTSELGFRMARYSAIIHIVVQVARHPRPDRDCR